MGAQNLCISLPSISYRPVAIRRGFLKGIPREMETDREPPIAVFLFAQSSF